MSRSEGSPGNLFRNGKKRAESQLEEQVGREEDADILG